MGGRREERQKEEKEGKTRKKGGGPKIGDTRLKKRMIEKEMKRVNIVKKKKTIPKKKESTKERIEGEEG